VAETPDKETQGDKQPEAAQQGASSRVPAIMVSLSALAIVGAATANSLPDFNRFSMPDFNRLSFSLPDFNRFSMPDFSRFAFSLPDFNRLSLPNFSRFTAPSSRETASVPIPDPVSATLKDIQSSQQQNAAVLVSLTQSSATQQADLKRISRQLSALASQVDTLQNAVTPLTTSSIPHSNPRARVVGTLRKITPPLPKPVGPVSVGGAPLRSASFGGRGPNESRHQPSRRCFCF
jgi:hypothetical protein